MLRAVPSPQGSIASRCGGGGAVFPPDVGGLSTEAGATEVATPALLGQARVEQAVDNAPTPMMRVDLSPPLLVEAHAAGQDKGATSTVLLVTLEMR